MILDHLMIIMICIVSARNDILSPLDTTRCGTYSIALWISWYVLYLIKMILDHLLNILIYIVSARNDMLLPLNTTRGGTYKIALWISWYVLYLLGMILDHLTSIIICIVSARNNFGSPLEIMIHIVSARNDILPPPDTTHILIGLPPVLLSVRVAGVEGHPFGSLYHWGNGWNQEFVYQWRSKHWKCVLKSWLCQ